MCIHSITILAYDDNLLVEEIDGKLVADSISIPDSIAKNEQRTFPSGVGISLGCGYNQLFWKLHNTDEGDANRLAFTITPTIRVQYNTNYDKKLFFVPFAEYNIFGGKDTTHSNGYIDKFWFQAIGAGTNVNFRLNQLEMGLGFKVNFIMKSTGYYYGSVFDSVSEKKEWDETDWTDNFARVSANVGARFGYSFWRFTVAFESWFGFTDLLKGSIFQFDKSKEWASAHETHYRILGTYNFP